jgi:hypothetical protein
METIVQSHEVNFNTLLRAAKDGALCLVDCIEKSTGEHVAVICAIDKRIAAATSSVHSASTKEEYAFTPFARFFNGNPYELLIPPTDEEHYTK